MDPITLAVIRGALEEITNEMDYVFERMAFSPVISDSWDRADGIYHPSTGEVFAQGPRGMPIFVAVMQHTTKALIDHAKGDIRPRDIFVVNDPYLGGTHLMDVKMLMPFFYQGEHVAYIANTGHWPDVAGRTPGGFSPKATDVYQEGLRLPPVRLFKEGALDDDLVRVILSNTRVPRERRGDIRAQATALEVGARRLTDLLDRYGRATVGGAIEELAARTEAQVRDSIRRIPPGTYSAEEFLDSDGIDFHPLGIRLDLTVSADGHMHFDFTRSDPPCRGPMNSVLATTISACCVAIKHLHPDAALNYGFFRPLRFTVPPTTFLNAQEPRPVAGCAAEVAQRIVEVVFGALAQAVPSQVPAGAFATISNLALGGVDPERGSYIFYSFGGGGYGGSSGSDGLTNGCSTTGLARTHSMEVVEQHYPIRVHEYAIRNESSGAGRFRGGFGTIFEFELLSGDAVVASLLGDRGIHPPRGAAGGEPGTTSHHRFFLQNKPYVPPHLTKDEGVALVQGDRIRLETPGGGGFGPPEERDPALVVRDVRRGYISRETAATAYRLVLTEDREVDERATQQLRGGADGRDKA